jgi:hypothetical protein
MESQQIVELLLAMRQEINANAKSMREDIKCRQAEMRCILDAWLTNIKNDRKETTACHAEMEATKTEPDPGMMQSTEEHQEIPKGKAAVMPVREPRKRRRVRNLAAERRQKRKERTRGNRGSRRKSAVACSEVSRRATVAWRKRNLIRRSGT